MEYRQFGKTDLTVSEIGFGAWGIGGEMWGPTDDEEARNALWRAFDLGVTFFDTAYAYGDGHSESLIGEALKQQRGDIVIATKIPPKTFNWPPLPHETIQEAFPADWIVSCTERSLRKLKTDYIDIQQLHVWSERWLEDTEWLETLAKLCREGKIRYFGVSACDWEPYDTASLVETGKIQSVQVIYNIFEQRPEEKLFPAAETYDAGIIARVPFEEGLLSGAITRDTQFSQGDWRKDWLPPKRLAEATGRIEALRKYLSESTPTLAELALKFCLHHPAISTVIPGMRRTKHVEQNCRASDRRKRLAPEVIAALRDHVFVHGWKYPWVTDCRD